MSEPADLSIADAAKLIERRTLSPVELTQSCLDRIAARDGAISAFLGVTAERAMRDAKAAEAEIAAGRYRGALHGIPYAAKDIIDVAGLRTTNHSKILADAPPATRDAGCVARLSAAGAVLVGKTALHEFATGGPAFDLPWPPARNPWNRDHHPGGSSSGSGAALAAGMVPAALGTDTGGSVRNPATCCGIVGMKPTYGAIGRSGVFPLSFSLDHVGPMSRTVEDNVLLFQAIAGHDPDDPASLEAPAADCLKDLRRGLRGLTIGIIDHFHTEDWVAAPEVAANLAEAVAVLRRLGAEVRPVRVSPLTVWNACARTLQQAEQYTIHETWLQKRAHDYAAITRRKLMAGALLPAASYVKALQARRLLAAEMAAVLREVDLVIAASSLDETCRIDEPGTLTRTYDRQARLPFNVTGTPAISVPSGFSKAGLPFGLQIAGRALDEATVYRAAWAFCEETGFTSRRPGL